MGVIETIFFFICLSFILVISGVALAVFYAKKRMTAFMKMQKDGGSSIYADSYPIGHDAFLDPRNVEEVIDAAYEVVETEKIDGEKP